MHARSRESRLCPEAYHENLLCLLEIPTPRGQSACVLPALARRILRGSGHDDLMARGCQDIEERPDVHLAPAIVVGLHDANSQRERKRRSNQQ